MKKYIIYRFTNNINNKCYIGLTTRTLKKRVYHHYYVAKRGSSSHFHRALMKYPKECWDIDILEEGSDTIQNIKRREVELIELHNTYNDGYNSTKGGEDFSSSEYQRQLQLDRVKNGTHPFVGGKIQSISMKKRHQNGEFKDQNKKRIENGTHHFVGERNPIKRLSMMGLQHNQQKSPWDNSKTAKSPESVRAWSMADQIYDWYNERKQRPRKSGYTLAERHFKFTCSLTIMFTKFKSGWIPQQDPEWLKRFKK